QAGIASSPSSVPSSTVSATQIQKLGFDLNGDGINDIAYFDEAAHVWKVIFGSPSGYTSAPVSTSITDTTARIGYVDGGATAGFLTGASGTLYYYRWNGSAFAATAVSPAGFSYTPTLQAVDVDGDGLADLVYADANGNLAVRLNTSSGGVVQFSST